MNSLQQVDLVELAGRSLHTAIVRCSLREADELASVVFDDIAKPGIVVPLEGFAPLAFSRFVCDGPPGRPPRCVSLKVCTCNLASAEMSASRRLGCEIPYRKVESEDGRDQMPVIRQSGISRRFLVRDCGLGSDGEVNPAVALRASADESRIVPPGTNEWIVDRPSVILESGVKGLHWAVNSRDGGRWLRCTQYEVPFGDRGPLVDTVRASLRGLHQTEQRLSCRPLPCLALCFRQPIRRLAHSPDRTCYVHYTLCHRGCIIEP